MRKIGGVLIIEPMGKAPCELCGEVDELRPYGPGGAWVCFDCGTKDAQARAIWEAAFDAIADGPGDKSQ